MYLFDRIFTFFKLVVMYGLKQKNAYEKFDLRVKLIEPKHLFQQHLLLLASLSVTAKDIFLS